MDGIACETEEEIRGGWATHFQRLPTPLQSNKFDNEYEDMVDADVEIISTLCEAEDRHITPIREKEVIASMKRLKNNKAVDVMGLTSEHFKLGSCSLIDFLTALLNNLISAKRVSAVLKEEHNFLAYECNFRISKFTTRCKFAQGGKNTPVCKLCT